MAEEFEDLDLEDLDQDIEKKNKVETRSKNLTQKRRLLKLVCLTNGWL